MVEKTIINNWNGGGTLQTWADGDWQILYAKDAAGNCITLSLNSDEAARLSYAVSPICGRYFDMMREYRDGIYELSYPEAKADELREIAKTLDCGGGCENCTPRQIENGKFCSFVAAENLRKLAAALDAKAGTETAPTELKDQIMAKFDSAIDAIKSA